MNTDQFIVKFKKTSMSIERVCSSSLKRLKVCLFCLPKINHIIDFNIYLKK